MSFPATFKTFGSDNQSGVHPQIMRALAEANVDHVPSYGADSWTARAEEAIRREFGKDAHALFVFGGTGANVVGLAALTRSYQGVICTTQSHLWNHESTAPERIGGCRLLPVDTPDGKLTVALIEPLLAHLGDVHYAQPKVISITQTNEVGLVYTEDEIRSLARIAHQRGLYLHMDGARLSNAAARLGRRLGECTKDLGVDVLTFGGTKNGLMFGEAVICFDGGLAAELAYLRKQASQLPSKMRFVSAQMLALLTDGLWLDSARHANEMAAFLAEELASRCQVSVAYPVQSNMVFANLPPELLLRLQARSILDARAKPNHPVRWVTSFDTTREEVSMFVDFLRNA